MYSGSDRRSFKDAGVDKKAIKNPPSLTLKAAVLIQRWYRRYTARLEMRRRCTWRIFQSIEYSGEQDNMKLSHFFDYLIENVSPRNKKDREFIDRILSEPETAKEGKPEKFVESVMVPDSYRGPRLSFPLTPDDAVAILEAFRNDQQLHPYYVLKLFQEAEHHLSQLPNIISIFTCYSEEITVCGDLHGQIFDLFHIFYKNGLPSPQKSYVFNGDYVDRGKHSIEILIILFVFLLIYPKEVILNRGNHEDYMINFRYGLTKEITRKYKDHANRILKVLKNVFSSLPLATLIDKKVLVVHGGVSDKTNLERLAKVERCKILSVLAPKRRKTLTSTELEGVKSVKPSHKSSGIRRYSGSSSALELDEISSDFSSSDDDDIQQYQMGQKESRTDSAIIPHNKVLDILWSDPDSRNGCRMNEERGGGCYFGPDVTEMFLHRHNLQFLIRSHECKPEGYEFCHNRKVITIFSASNYYATGSNRGAYIKLGPDLIPHFVQFQATKGLSRQMTMTQRISRVEESAYQILREKLFAYRSELTVAFKSFDKKNTGFITLNDWAKAIESVLHLGLPWRMLRPHLVLQLTNGKLEYRTWLRDIVTEERSSTQELAERRTNWLLHILSTSRLTEMKTIVDQLQTDFETRLQSSLLENIYRNLPSLETIFSIIDSDNSGFISLEEFHQTWKLFSSHMNISISDENINDLARSIDFNKDGNIDFNEFIEAFRLVRQQTS